MSQRQVTCRNCPFSSFFQIFQNKISKFFKIISKFFKIISKFFKTISKFTKLFPIFSKFYAPRVWFSLSQICLIPESYETGHYIKKKSLKTTINFSFLIFKLIARLFKTKFPIFFKIISIFSKLFPNFSKLFPNFSKLFPNFSKLFQKISKLFPFFLFFIEPKVWLCLSQIFLIHESNETGHYIQKNL